MMLFRRFFVLLAFTPSLCLGQGLPIFDGQEMVNKMKDSLYFISTLETLLKEVGGKSTDLVALNNVASEIRKYQEQVALYEQLGGAVDDFSSFSYGRSKVLTDQINSITRHIRKLKIILTLAKTIGARPEAINASMQVLKDERVREKEKFEIALMAFEEKERLSNLRRKVTRKINIKRALVREALVIESFSRGGSVKSISFQSRNFKKKDSLW